MTTIERIRALGVIPVAEIAEVGQAEPLFAALSAGGLPIAEITLRTPAGIGAVAALVKAHPAALIGAGTVRSVEAAAQAAEAGARFIVSPGMDPQIVRFCSDNGLLALPGACTPTEIQAALRTGVTTVKFFPAEAMGGVSFLKAVAGPFRDVEFVPTGGISPANLLDYLKLPQVVACGGSWMVSPNLLAMGDYGRVQELTAQAAAIVAELRKQ